MWREMHGSEESDWTLRGWGCKYIGVKQERGSIGLGIKEYWCNQWSSGREVMKSGVCGATGEGGVNGVLIYW